MPSKSITDLKSVKEFFEENGKELAIKVLKICENKKKPFIDEEIAKKLKVKVTEVRAVLNKMHYQRIAIYQKSKNQKTGWYNYTWEIKKNKLAEILIEQQNEKIKEIKNKMSIEQDYNYFHCKDCDEKMAFENAIEYNFICMKCGGTLDSKSIEITKQNLEKEIKNIEKEIDILLKIK
jgi:transcription initiation factor TFIIE subunit alpha